MVTAEKSVSGGVICVQIGARDHYAFPRAFKRMGVLDSLHTDYWNRFPFSLPGALLPRSSGRWHADLPDEDVISPNVRGLWRRFRLRSIGKSGWDGVLAMNREFQRDILRGIERRARAVEKSGARVVVFAYSYAARDIFRVAKARGWGLILGQIDPGPEEDRLIQELRQRHSGWKCARTAAPSAYYDAWGEEVDLADRVIVNSGWTAMSLKRSGVGSGKLACVPIPFDGPVRPESAGTMPVADFSDSRPLRILFLGQVNLRKGICELLGAIRMMRGEPVELSVVGDQQVQVPEEFKSLPRVKWVGAVARQDVGKYFQACDVFILPTHSDGFGLTQLEALAHGKPVIASLQCAPLVKDGVNGRLLPEVSPLAISRVLKDILSAPYCLCQWSAACEVPNECSMDSVAPKLVEVMEQSVQGQTRHLHDAKMEAG